MLKNIIPIPNALNGIDFSGVNKPNINTTKPKNIPNILAINRKLISAIPFLNVWSTVNAVFCVYDDSPYNVLFSIILYQYKRHVLEKASI